MKKKILNMAAPCYTVQVSHESARESCSHLAGLPYLPPNFEWPREGEDYQTFLAQIHLADLPEPRIGLLPHEGMLQIFLGMDESCTNIKHNIFYFSGPLEAFQPTPSPGPTVFEEERDFSRLNISFDHGISLQEFPLEGYDEYYGTFHTLRQNLGLTKWQSHLLGEQQYLNDDPRIHAYFTACGRPGLIYNEHQTPDEIREDLTQAIENKNESLADYYRNLIDDLIWYHENLETHPGEIAKWRLLLQLDSYLDAGLCWWDAGMIYFLIHEDDLARRVFSRTFCGIETS